MKTWCIMCKKETNHKIIDTKPGDEATGLIFSEQWECQVCGHAFWV